MSGRFWALLAVVATGTFPAAGWALGADDRLDALGEEFLQRWLTGSPQVATRLGVHRDDRRLVPITEATIDQDLAWMRAFRARLAGVAPVELSPERAIDRELLAARVDRELLDLEVVKPYRTNPTAYVDLVGGAIQSLMDRDFESVCSRTRSVARRLAWVPEVLRAARVNLRHPARVHTETAITQFRGVLRLYREGIPAAVALCREPVLQADLAEADTAAVRAVETFIEYLERDLLPRSDGSFALGRAAYQLRLAAGEMEVAPVDSLLARGDRSIAETTARMEVVAERVAPGAGVRGALAVLERESPDPDDLIPYVTSQLDSLRAFVRAHDLVTLPAREDLTVRETPGFRRGPTFASMNAPGVWERRATRAYYQMTPAEPSWSERERRDHAAFFNRYSVAIVSAHEALPGHYLQGLALRKAPTRLRQALTSGSGVEGWAHYCEQMMVEEGLGGGDPRFELAQLQLALQGLGRLVVAIRLHTSGMTIAEGARFLEERCFMAEIRAASEARRGAGDLGDLAYTLGKWHILDLRDEARRALGPKFRLRDFHDALLQEGAAPLPAIRERVLAHLGAVVTP